MDEPLNIAVCEDSPEDQQHLLDILAKSTIPVRPTVFGSGEALLENYRPGQYDLLLTDIYMGGITGVETVTRIRRMDEQIPVAFVTSSTDHALESYRLSALKYIEKPYREKEIREILMLAGMKRDTAPALTLKVAGKEEKIRLSRILYLEQHTHHLTVHRKADAELSACEKLSSLLPRLEQLGFFSPHKSYAVNLSHVLSIDRELRCFVMADGTNVPIRRESMGKARQALEDHLFDRTRDGSL